MKLFKFFIAIFAMVVGISLNSQSQARFATQYYSYNPTLGSITDRTSWIISTDQHCNASSNPCNISSAPTGDGHPNATTFNDLITPSSSFTQPATLPSGFKFTMKL